MDAYTPVSCDFHDQLEALATLHQDCHLVYHDDANQIIEVNARIVDVYARNHADFLKIKDGTEIRLDRIVSVNDQPVSYGLLD
ncbi:hypothetical protein ACN4EK_22130 [Pantanalinema rosaneae CENA516]|uniref:hypothetical protein n=1 Tax=Pantanalinema rosaneae TaxID=1620701 RepID=UPI003D6FD15F